MRKNDREGTFDRNQISPDTPYMRKLEKELSCRFPYVKISTTQEEGEGEHKIFTELKSIPENEREKICIYGLDADLILLSLFNANLASGEFSLLRESGEFNDPTLKGAEFSKMYINKLIDQLPIPIDQYLALSVLCFGNDFMPSLGIFSLREDGYARALDFYKCSGSPDLQTEEGRNKFLEYSKKQEIPILQERIRLRKRPEERAIVGKDIHSISRKYGLHILDGVENMEPVIEAFWKTFHWTMHYFKNNTVLNWNWVFPYPDAPLIQDLAEYYETDCEPGNLDYTITKQLQFILPLKCLKTTKRKSIFPDEIYTETRIPWMKNYDWEMKPAISLPWNPNYDLTSVSLL